MQKYVPQIRNTEIREIELKSTLESLKNDMERLSCEVQGLRKDKQMLEAQLQIVKTEKKLHVEEHVRQKQQWEQDFKDISDRINAEKSQFKTELIYINHQMNKLQQELKGIKLKKKQQSDNYKRIKDEECSKRLKEKDRMIKSLEKRLEEKLEANNELRQQLRVYQEEPKEVHPRSKTKSVKRKSNKKCIRVESPRSPVVHELSPMRSLPVTQRHARQAINELSLMIADSEREQALLNNKFEILERMSGSDKEKKKLKEIINRHDERLQAAKSLQDSIIKERLFVSDL